MIPPNLHVDVRVEKWLHDQIYIPNCGFGNMTTGPDKKMIRTSRNPNPHAPPKKRTASKFFDNSPLSIGVAPFFR